MLTCVYYSMKKNDLNYQKTWMIKVQRHYKQGLNVLTLSLWIKPGQITPVTLAQLPLNFVGDFITIKKPYQVRVLNNGPILVTVALQDYATRFLSSGVSWGQALPSPLVRSHAWDKAKKNAQPNSNIPLTDVHQRINSPMPNTTLIGEIKANFMANIG